MFPLDRHQRGRALRAICIAVLLVAWGVPGSHDPGSAAVAQTTPAPDDDTAAPTQTLTQTCPVHTVSNGDTLRLIALRYFGSRDQSPRIYAANRDTIGRNPNLIETGMRLAIPCADAPPPQGTGQMAHAGPADASRTNPEDMPTVDPLASLPRLTDPLPSIGAAPGDASTAGVRTRPDEALANSLPEPDDRPPMIAGDADTTPIASADAPLAGPQVAMLPETAASLDDAPQAVTDMLAGPDQLPLVTVLTGAPYDPFVGKDRPGGGLAVALLRAAFEAAPGASVEIAFVNDRAAHLDVILPRGGFALSFPWSMPDCPASDDMAMAPGCSIYVTSHSLYEHVSEYYVRADRPWANVQVASQLSGARFCHPAGYPHTDLTSLGLPPAALQSVTAPTPRDCLEMIDEDRADITAMDASIARALVASAQLAHPLVVLEGLTRIERLRAVALRGDPDGEQAISQLNSGLEAIVESGVWFDTVAVFLRRLSS